MSEKLLKFIFENQSPMRLDHFLTEKMPEHSRSAIHRLIQNQNVWVNEVAAKKNGLKLKGSEKIEVIIPPAKVSELIPENIPLEVIFENKDVLVVNKKAGMVVHPSAGHDTGTLVHAALAHAPDIQGVGGVIRPGIVHRLDKDTSGVILMAKNDHAHRFLQAQFKDRSVGKIYHALVDGHPPTPVGRVEAPIGRDILHRQRMAVVPENKGKEAISQYQVIEKFENHAYLEVRIFTGRTHQIRLHMAFINCPIAGDLIYGKRNPSVPLERHFLHASQLSITLPRQTMPQTFIAPLPTELEKVLELQRKM